jgi:hypothetical protein
MKCLPSLPPCVEVLYIIIFRFWRSAQAGNCLTSSCTRLDFLSKPWVNLICGRHATNNSDALSCMRLPHSRFDMQSRTYWRQMCEALHYAHSKQVTHRDIKPENLLLDGRFNLRVADWGLSSVQVDADAAVLKTQCGTKARLPAFCGCRRG